LFPRPRAIVGLFDDPGVRGGLANPRSRFERVVLERPGFRFRCCRWVVRVVVVLGDGDGRGRGLRFLFVELGGRHGSRIGVAR
jgi:hypothetical protein